MAYCEHETLLSVRSSPTGVCAKCCKCGMEGPVRAGGGEAFDAFRGAPSLLAKAEKEFTALRRALLRTLRAHPRNTKG